MKSLYSIVGMKHRGQWAVDLVSSLRAGEPITLIREPTNRHDPFAVQVWAQGQHVGFIKGAEVKPLALEIDANGALPLAGQPGPSVEGKFAVSADRWPQVEVDL